MKFVLKQYDTELLSFDLWSEGLDGFACTSSRFMTDRQRKQLWKLIGFRFTRDRNYNLPSGMETEKNWEPSCSGVFS